MTGHRCAGYPSSSLTDAQWALLEPLLPPPGNTAGRATAWERWKKDRIGMADVQTLYVESNSD